jgi:hypothetical protein
MSAQPQWQPAQQIARPRTLPDHTPDGERGRARILPAIALASIGAGTIHIAAAATIGRDSAQNLAFFVVVAVAQIVWGAVALAWAPRWWLALGAAGNLVVVATWVVSRTVALPFGEYAGITLPVGFADALATVLAAVVVVGAVTLLLRGQGPARSAGRSRGFTAAAAVLVGALALAGVLSQADAFGSSPSGSGGNGGGGVSGPYAPGGGNDMGGGSSGTSGSGGGYGYGY